MGQVAGDSFFAARMSKRCTSQSSLRRGGAMEVCLGLGLVRVMMIAPGSLSMRICSRIAKSGLIVRTHLGLCLIILHFVQWARHITTHVLPFSFSMRILVSAPPA